MESIAQQYKAILERIKSAALRAGRDPKTVGIVGIVKHQPLERIAQAAACGLSRMGENYAQDLLPKKNHFPNIEWHFTGKLQRNKVKIVVPHVQMIHSVDSKELALEIQKRALEAGKHPAILIEVNLENKPNKGGVSPQMLPELAREIRSLSHVDLKGLMVQPPYFEEGEKSRPYFRRVGELLVDLQRSLELPLNELSMGTSHDFEIAIEEGATLVRLGTILFGERMK